MMFCDILWARTLSAFMRYAILVLNFVPSEAFEALIGCYIRLSNLMMNWVINTEISKVWKLSTDAAGKLFKGQNIHFIGGGLAVHIIVTEIKWLCLTACVGMHVHLVKRFIDVFNIYYNKLFFEKCYDFPLEFEYNVLKIV
jgi:hypothetical protein